MARLVRKAKNAQPHPEHWVISYEFQIVGRMKLVPGREFRVSGERGRFIYKRHVLNTKTGMEWIDATSANPKKRASRSFALERVTRVHRKITVHPAIRL